MKTFLTWSGRPGTRTRGIVDEESVCRTMKGCRGGLERGSELEGHWEAGILDPGSADKPKGCAERSEELVLQTGEK